MHEVEGRLVDRVPGVGIADDHLVFMGVVDAQGHQVAQIDSGHESVLEWAQETFVEFREVAEPLTIEEFEG